MSDAAQGSGIVRPQGDYLTGLTGSVRIEIGKTALVIIDMQYATGSRNHGLGKRLQDQETFEFARWRFDRAEQVVVPNIIRLLDAFRKHQMQVIHVKHGAEKSDFSDASPIMKETYRATNNRLGTREHEFLDELKPLPEEYVVHKRTVGAFSSSNIDFLLRSLGMEVLVFVGYSTNMCVDLTARVAADMGYRCILIEDGCGAATEEYHKFSVLNFQRLFGRVASTQEVIDELESVIRGQD